MKTLVKTKMKIFQSQFLPRLFIFTLGQCRCSFGLLCGIEKWKYVIIIQKFYAPTVILCQYTFQFRYFRNLNEDYFSVIKSFQFQILWTIPFGWVQWVLVAIGAVMSGLVLLFTFWPALKGNTAGVRSAMKFCCNLLEQHTSCM